MQRTFQYLRTHLWYTVSLTFGIAIICTAICYQRYMKYKYADFLLEKNYMMEEAVLDTMQKNLDYSLMEYIDLGAKISIERNIYELADSVFLSEQADTAMDTRDLKSNLQVLAGMSSNILNISAVSSEGKTCQYDRLLRNDSTMWSIDDEENLAHTYEKLNKQANSAEVPRYIVDCLPSKHPTSGEQVFHIFYPLIGNNYSFSQMNNMLAITYKMDMLKPFLETSEEEKDSYSVRYITDDKGTVIYHSDEDYIGKSETVYLSSSSFLTLEKELVRVGWTLHIALDKEKLNRNVDGILWQGMIAYCLLLAALMVVFYYMMRKITKPLNKIKIAMDVTGSQGKRKKVAVEGEHEIWQVAAGYNEMLDRLKLQEMKAEKQHKLTLLSLERQHQAEWEALETQINAHFICNTLGTINYEALEVGNFKVSHLIKKLSNILRYTFDQKKQKVYMCQEMAWIEQYLFLQKARLEDVFEYKIEFDESLAHWPCCKLMLQPFVENAIIHGFEGRENGGYLNIRADKAGELLKLTIEDNGCGISEEKCRGIQEMLMSEQLEAAEGIGIGIQNVASRMRMFYGKDVQITLTSKPQKGTVFVFWLPFPAKQKINSQIGGGYNALDDCGR